MIITQEKSCKSCTCHVWISEKSGFGAHECHTCPTCPDARCQTERQPATETLVPPGKWWVAGVDTLLVAFFKSSTHNFPFAFSHLLTFCIGSLPVYPHPDFPRTLCFACTVNFKFCHCEAVDTLPVSFPPFDPLRSASIRINQ